MLAETTFPFWCFDLAVKLSHGRLDCTEVAARSGVPADLIRTIWKASGLPEPQPDQRALNDVDVESMAMLHGAGELLGRDATIQLISVMGAATARIADAMVSGFIAHADIAPTVVDPVGLSRAHANAVAADLLPATAQFLDLPCAVTLPECGDPPMPSGKESRAWRLAA